MAKTYLALQDEGIRNYTQTALSTLSGSGTNGRFKAVAGGTATSFTIGGKSYGVKQGEESEIEIVSGCWYTFILDEENSTINFKQGVAGIPNGETVTPVNDVKVWQKCAGLSPIHTTVQQILGDTVTLRTLINNANAMEYFIRSINIQTAILNNTDAVSFLENSLPYVTPDMTGRTTPEGAVTSSDDNAANYKIFGNGTDSVNSSGLPNDGWVQYELPDYWRNKWFFKARYRVTYSIGTAKLQFAGVTEDNQIIMLSDVLNSTATTGSQDEKTVTLKPSDKKFKAVRLYKRSDNTAYLSRAKFWGK